MKLQTYIFFIIISFLLGCSTSPYLKETELPKNIQYFSADKQFKVEPEWYWRVRPDIHISFKEIINNTEEGTIIGECIKDDQKFYIVKWEHHGFYFIEKKDYFFAMKYKQYLIPLKYNDKSLYKDPFGRLTCITPLELLIKTSEDENRNYQWNLENRMATYYQEYKIIHIFQIAHFVEKISSTGFINKEDFKNEIQSQIMTNGSYSNTFLLIPPTNGFYEFCSNPLVRLQTSQYVSSFYKNINYTNNYGMVFNGNAYRVKYIIAQWGKYYYAFPTNSENK